MRTQRSLIFSLFLAVLLVGCTSGGHSKPATLDQKAFSLYGSFVVLEETAAKIATDPAAPKGVIQSLQEADALAKPAADVMYDAAVILRTVREAEGDEDLATVQLEAAMTEAIYKIGQMRLIVRDYRETKNGPNDPSRPTP